MALTGGRADDGARADARAARHESDWVHALPSSQADPLATLLHELVLIVGWHDWQAFAGLAAPAATQALPMRQLPAASTCEQSREARVGGARDAVRRARGAVGGNRSRAGARGAVAGAGGVALICGRAHDRARADARAALEHESDCVHALPSSQAAPFAALLHELVLIVGRHDWQPFAGLVAPAATQALPMRQLPAASTCEQEPALHASVVQLMPSDAQAVPLAATGFEQTPVARSQAPAEWH